MPIQIGQAEPGCDDPVGLMTACHRRIERFLQTLRNAANRCGGRPLAKEECEAIGRSLRYFREAAPKHTADEEEDLFPALMRKAPDAADSVRRLVADHIRAGNLHAEVDLLGEKWMRDGVLSREDLQTFEHANEELETLYRDHIKIEEGQVFPQASRELDSRELEAIGRRMAERRGVAFRMHPEIESLRIESRRTLPPGM